MAENEPQPRKTDEELRELWGLFTGGTAYEDFPDGATWADLKDAQELAAKEAREDA